MKLGFYLKNKKVNRDRGPKSNYYEIKSNNFYNFLHCNFRVTSGKRQNEIHLLNKIFTVTWAK